MDILRYTPQIKKKRTRLNCNEKVILITKKYNHNKMTMKDS